MKRRTFVKTSSAAVALATGVTKTGWAVGGEDYELEKKESPTDLYAACPYCGVGCGTIIKTKNGRITNVIPDKDHPTNKGLQCIKGLTSAEAIYVNRLDKPLVRKDMSNHSRVTFPRQKVPMTPSTSARLLGRRQKSLFHTKLLISSKTPVVTPSDSMAPVSFLLKASIWKISS